ncbi:MAG: phosphotransferase [Thermoleophilia bacterium]|nr:phosphotransferase [Thermoleophilia bacterium]
MAGTGLGALTHAAWVERVPDLVAERRRAWGLRLGALYVAGAAGYTVRAELPDGAPAVLKLVFPHRESEHEADALALWDGDGAVRLLARDPDGHALLLERCEPGTPLGAVGADAALGAMVGLLPRLWKPAGAPFRPLAEEAEWWADSLPAAWERLGRPFPRRLLELALHALAELPPTQGEQVLLHQDLHADNVLAAAREPWLAIDPKPLVGEREFGVAALVRGGELGHSRHDVVYRLDRLTAELGLDRERARLWALAQTLAWAFDDDEFHPDHVEIAGWLADA